jgi:hypothetical protein
MEQLRVSQGEDAEALKKDVIYLSSLGWKTDSDEMGRLRNVLMLAC